MVHEEYTELIRKRYYNQRNTSYETMGDYDYVFFAPFQYKIEASMLKFAKNNPQASLRDICNYCDSIIPEGLAPDDNGDELF